MSDAAKALLFAVASFVLGLLGLRIGRGLAGSKGHDGHPDTSGVVSDLSDAAGRLGQAAGEAGGCADAAAELHGGLAVASGEADGVGGHVQRASELIGDVIADASGDEAVLGRVDALLAELAVRMGGAGQGHEDEDVSGAGTGRTGDAGCGAGSDGALNGV